MKRKINYLLLDDMRKEAYCSLLADWGMGISLKNLSEKTHLSINTIRAILNEKEATWASWVKIWEAYR